MNLLESFITILTSQKPAPSKATVKNYKADIAKFIRWFENTYNTPFEPKSVTSFMLDAYKNHVTQEENEDNVAIVGQTNVSSPLALKSFQRHLSSLRKFFNFLKVGGYIDITPFEQMTNNQPQAEADKWHIKAFKDHLYVYNASDLTIKNYITDVKQFLSWAETVIPAGEMWEVTQKDVFAHIDTKLVNEYKQRLYHEAELSPVSINRKLSSLRRFILWAQKEQYLNINKSINITNEAIATDEAKTFEHPLSQTEIIQAQNGAIKNDENDLIGTEKSQVITNQKYSNIPPLRLFQKIGHVISLGIEASMIAPVAVLALKLHFLKWQLSGASVFVKSAKNVISNASERSREISRSARNDILGITSVKNFKKEMYNPTGISLASLPLHRKAWHHIRHTRPEWYRRYHQNPLAHYFHFAILMVVMTAIGVGLYQGFVNDPAKNRILAAPSSPPRILSFQGRLTDSSDNPITTAATPLRFAIYNDSAASGSALLWQEVDNVSPDADGIFSILLGNNTTIPQNLFGDNPSLWLGVTVQSTSELTPRQQIATVPYATNSELLQGMAPITQVGAGTTNVVLALNSSGNLVVSSGNPVFQATSGTFTLQGTTTVISTTTGSGGNVQIAPDGLGKIDLQKPVFNSTNNNNISSAIGAVEVDDLFAILATSSGQSAFTLNQNGGGPLISASASGVAKFTVGNTGQITDAAYTTGGGVLYGTTTGLISQTGAGGATQCLLGGAGTPVFGSCGAGVDDFWDVANGTLYPSNSTLDFLIGGQSTASANFAVLNNNSGIPVASVSGNFIVMKKNGGGGNVGIGTSTPSTPLQVSYATTSLANFTSTSTQAPTLTIAGTDRSVTFGAQVVSGLSNMLAIQGGVWVGNGSSHAAVYFTNTNATTTNGVIGEDSTNVADALQVDLDSATPASPIWKGPDGLGSNIAGGSFTIAAGRGTGTGAGGSLLFSTANAGPSGSSQNSLVERMRIDYNGNIGIGTTAPVATLHVRNTVNAQAAGIFDTTMGTDILTASASGVPKFTVANTGALTDAAYTNAGGILYTSTTGLIGQTGAGTSTQCLLGGTTPTFGSCSTGSYWDQQNGLLFASNTTVDFAVGGTSSTSAKFAVVGVNTTTPAASLAGTLSIKASTATQTVSTFNLLNGTALNFATSVGGDAGTTSRLFIDRDGNAGNVGIGTTTPGAKLQVIGLTQLAGNSSFSASNALEIGNDAIFADYDTTNTISLNGVGNAAEGGLRLGTGGPTLYGKSGNLGIGNINPTGATLDITGSLRASSTITFSTFTTNGGLLYTNGSGVLSQTGAGTSAQCLTGGTTPSYQSCNIGPNDFLWSQSNGALYPNNSTVDLLIGGVSTASAKFAFINVNSGNPTASISGNLALAVPTTAGADTLGLLNNSTFNIGTSVGGDAGFTSRLFIDKDGNAGNVGIGTTTPTSKLTIGALSSGGTTSLEIGAVSGAGTTNRGILINSVSGATSNNTIETAANAGTGSTVTRGMLINNITGANTNNYGINIGRITGASSQNIAIVTNANTAPVASAQNLMIQTGAFSGTANSSTNKGLEIGANSVAGTSVLSYGITVGAFSGSGTSTTGILINGSTATATSNYGMDIAAMSGAGTTNTGIRIGAISGATNNYAIITGTGNVGFGLAAPVGNFHVSGTTNTQAAAIFDTTMNIPLLTASASGVAKFTISNTGALTSAAYTNAGGILYTSATGLIGQTAAGTGTQCLLGGTTPAFGNCNVGGYWTQQNGVLYPSITSTDFLIGGTSTASANFAVLNNNTGIPVASVSGNFIVMPKNGGGGNVGIGTTNPSKSLVLTQKNATDGFQFTGTSIDGTNTGTGFTVAVGHNASGNKQLWLGDTDGIGSSSYDFMRFVTTGTGSLPTLDGVTGDGATRTKIVLGVAGDTNSGVYVGQLLGVNGNAAIGTGYYNVAAPSNGLIVQGSVGIGNSSPSTTLDVTGTLKVSSTTTFGGIAYTWPGSQSSNYVLQTNGSGLLSWVDVTAIPGGNFWNQINGALYPKNSTVDLLVGGVSTVSAKFAIINMNSGNPTATISGNLALAVPTTAGANTLGLLNNSTLNIGTSVGGDAGFTSRLFIDKDGNGGNVGIGTTAPTSKVHISTTSNSQTVPVLEITNTYSNTFIPAAEMLAPNMTNGQSTYFALGQVASNYNRAAWSFTRVGLGSTSNFMSFGFYGADSLLNVQASGNVGIGITNPTSLLHVNGTTNFVGAATFGSTTTLGGISYTWPGSQASNYILQTNGSGILSWVDVSAAGINYWKQQNGALFPNNATVDLLIGGVSTASAKFAFINVAGGNPTATISGNLSLVVPSGNQQINTLNLLNGGALNITTSVGGDAGATSRLYVARDGLGGNIGIGTTTPGFGLEVAGTTRIDGNTTIGDASGDSLTINAATLSLANASTLDLANASTTSLNIESGLLDFDTTNSRIGIGNTGPRATLDVTGSASVSANLSFAGAGTTHNVDILDGGVLQFRVAPGGTGQSNAMQIGANGNVGIGQAAPVNGRLAVNRTFTATTPNFDLGLINTSSVTGVGGGGYLLAGLYNYNSVNLTPGATTLGTLRSADNEAAFQSTATSQATAVVTNLIANYNLTNITGTNSTGTITNSYNLVADGVYGGGGTNLSVTIGNQYGLMVSNQGNPAPYAGLTISKAAGIAIANITAATNSANLLIGTTTIPTGTFSIYNSSAYDNYIAGNVGINITNPTFKLDVSGTTRISGAVTLSNYTGNNAVLYGTTGTGLVASATTSTANLCLISGAGAGFTPSWASCNSVINDAFWSQQNGALYPNNSTVDFFIGGQASSSANFAVLNNNSGIPVASVSGNFIVMPKNGGGGNVGIGMTTPNYPLFVQGATSGQMYVRSTGANKASITIDDFAGSQQSIIELSDAAAVKWQIGKQTNNTFMLYDAANTRNTIQTATNGDLIFQPTAGNVGIGTVSPLARLTVGDTTSDAVHIGQVDPATGAWIRNDGSNTVFATKVGSIYIGYNGASNPINFMPGGTTTQMILSTTGNLGIAGQTTTQANLSFPTAGADKIRLYGTTATANYGIGIASGNMQFYTPTSSTFFSFNKGGDLNTAGTNELMRIQSDGNVGIGTTAPGTLLQVAGAGGIYNTTPKSLFSLYNTDTSTASNAAQMTFYANRNGGVQTAIASISAVLADAGGTTYNGDLIFSTAPVGNVPVPRMIINGFGNVGIGTTLPRAQLDVKLADGITGGTIRASTFADTLGNYFLTPAATGISMAVAGNVGIGTTTPLTALEVAGNLIATAAPASQSAALVKTSLDTTGDVGASTSAAIAPDGFPVISYYDTTNGDLKVYKCTTTSCSAGGAVTVDSTNDIGRSSSIAIGTDGFPIISYYDVTNGDLKVTKCGRVNCATTPTNLNTTTTVASTNDVGKWNSLAIGSDGLPVISFYDFTVGKLHVLHCGNVACSSGNNDAIAEASASNLGAFNAIVIGTDGLPVISYYDSSASDLRVIKCGNIYCNTSNTATSVDTTGVVGQYTSIAIDSDGLPIIAYYDVTNLDLKVFKCTTASCSSGTAVSPDTGGNVGQFTSITIANDGLPLISYYDVTNTALKTTKCLAADCNATSGYTTTTIDTATTGRDSSILSGTDNLPVISYYDSGNGDLKSARCGNNACSGNSYTNIANGMQIGGFMANSRSYSLPYQNINTMAISNPSTWSNLSFNTGGSSKMVITPSGNVGIGITAPLAPLHIFGAPATSRGQLVIDSTTTTTEMNFYQGATRKANFVSTSNDLFIGNQTAAGRFGLAVNSGNTEALTIISTGNVGIGTTAPVGNLHINGTINTRAAGIFDTTMLNDVFTASVSGATKFVIKNSGNVGIGTNLPAALFDTKTATNRHWAIRDNSSLPQLLAMNDGAQSYVSGAIDASTLILNQASGGNVGINSTAPTSLLEVKGAPLSTFANATSGLLTLNSNSASADQYATLDFRANTYTSNNPLGRIGVQFTGSGTFMNFGTSNNYASGITNTAMTIKYDGNVGINNTTPTSKLYVDGGSVSTNAVANITSIFNSTNTTSSGQGYGLSISATQLNGSTCSSCALFGIVSRIDTTGSTTDLLGAGYGYYIGDATGTANTITNLYGLTVADLTKGHTQNIAVNLSVSSGTGKYNVYAGGTAQNYFAGNVGIANATPSYPIDVSGQGRFTGNVGIGNVPSGTFKLDVYAGTTGYAVHGQTGDTTSGGAAAYFDGGNCSTILAWGNVGGQNWTNCGTGGFTSDARLKKDVKPLSGGLDTIMALKPVTYLWNNDNRNGPLLTDPSKTALNYGFIAQDVMHVLPDLVGEGPALDPNGKPDPNGERYYYLTYLGILPPLVNAVQDLNAKVELNTATLSAQLAAIPNLSLASTGDLAIASTPDPVRYQISKGGTVFTQIAALSDVWAANVKAGIVDAQKYTVAGQDLKDYIIAVVQQAGFTNNNNIVAPIASIDRVYTNALSPLPSGDGALHVDGNLAVSGSINASAASVSGTLTASKVESGDGVFNGTLRAKNIIADNIEGLTGMIATLSAQTVNNITNVYQASPSASIYADENATHSALLASLGLLDQQNSYASASGNLNLTNVTADFGTFNQGLIALGPSSFTDVSVAGQFSVGGSLILADNAINTLGTALEIQSLKQGVVSIMGDLIHIDTNGDVNFGGNATFAKDVRVQGKIIGSIISPIPNEDMVIDLGNDAIPTNSQFKIKNASGSAVLAVNQLGDVTASGAGTFTKLNLSIIQQAVATGAGDLISFGSAGVATISATRSEITVHNSLVTDKSLIYITPVGTSSAQGTYLMRQKPGDSFTVGGVAGAVFNWLIIN